jgi:hypothetical protein
VKEGTRVELLAIPLVGVIFGIGALVLFAATEGPWGSQTHLGSRSAPLG